MINREHTREATAAEQMMAIDVFSELLASTDPALMGSRLTEQLRELTGAKTVLLIKHDPDRESHSIIHVTPERRSSLFSSSELGLFCPDHLDHHLPPLVKDLPDNSPLKQCLLEKGIDSLLSIPLTGNGELIASILILNLPGLERIDETLSVVAHLAPFIALALRNAFSHERIQKQAAELTLLTEELEARVVERTAQVEESNRNLHQSLREKETLIRELYHRTKNTMQVVSGILKLQAAQYPENEDIQDLVKLTDDRIQAIALVQQMLYASQDLSRISIREYIGRLTNLIADSQGSANKRIAMRVDVADLEFLIDSAIPLGLVLTELMTNSFKYAFPGDREGSISITLTVNDAGGTLVTYADDGVGVSEDFDFKMQPSLGMQLIFSITTQQLHGKATFERNNGLTCNLEFPKSLYVSRV